MNLPTDNNYEIWTKFKIYIFTGPEKYLKTEARGEFTLKKLQLEEVRIMMVLSNLHG